MHTARMTTDLPAEYWRLHGAAREPAAALTQACIFTAAHLGLLHSARDLHIRTHATLVVALAHSPARRILDALLHALLHAFNTAHTAQHDSTTARQHDSTTARQHDTNNDRTIERQNDATQSDRITERRTNSTNSTDKWPHKDSQSTRGTPHCPLWSRYAVVLRGSNSWPAAQSDGDWIHCTKTVAQTSVWTSATPPAEAAESALSSIASMKNTQNRAQRVPSVCMFRRRSLLHCRSGDEA